MSAQDQISFNNVLASREMSGAALARAISTGEATISRLRNGMRPGDDLAKRITEALNLTDAELVALGWARESVG